MSNFRNIDVDHMSTLFKALSNPQRLRIFLRFSGCGGPRSCEATDKGIHGCVGELGEDLHLAASTVSHHIKELRHAGLLQVERRGQRIECWISDEVLQRLAAFFAGVRERANGKAGLRPARRSTNPDDRRHFSLHEGA
jgi:DNA-binding transcriptional ArsR family regulator